jgi:hypothetical protein
MGPDELLIWLSARASGSWGQFRSAVEKVMPEEAAATGGPYPLYQRLRFSLQQLGHVEFDGKGYENGWRVTPPVLALSAHPGAAVGVLTGARLPQTLARFHTAFGAFTRQTPKVPEQPGTVRVEASVSQALAERAAQLELTVQPEAPITLLSCLPSIEQLTRWHAEDAGLPRGRDFEIKRFEINKKHRAWEESSHAEAANSQHGLFRFTRYSRPEHYLKTKGKTLRLPGAIGKFYLLAEGGRQVMRYNKTSRSLTLPPICRPPLLVDRALILCSGSLPVLTDNGTLAYSEISEEVAGLAASILRQNRL